MGEDLALALAVHPRFKLGERNDLREEQFALRRGQVDVQVRKPERHPKVTQLGVRVGGIRPGPEATVHLGHQHRVTGGEGIPEELALWPLKERRVEGAYVFVYQFPVGRVPPAQSKLP